MDELETAAGTKSPRRALKRQFLDPAPAPEVFNYTDYRLFLRDMLQHLSKVNGSRFSLRAISRRMDLGGPSSLSMISNCQRHLPEEKVAKCINALGLDNQSAEYFELIHLLARARTEADRKRIEEKIQICFGSGLFKGMIDEGSVFARQWYLSALREATVLKSTSKVTDASVAALSEALGIAPAEVERGFQVLIERGLLSKSTEGKLERTDPSIHNFGRTNAFSMLNYNIRVLEQSIKAAVMSNDRRYFETLTVAIPKALFPEIKQRIKRFFREVDMMAEGSEGRTQVVQMNMQFFTQFDETPEN